MLSFRLSFAAALALTALSPLVHAQDEHGMPTPAPELQKFAPLIGSWTGKGTFNEPATGEHGWTAQGTYRWSHNKFWVEENFKIEFEGQDTPMVFRAYLGWDAETKRFVNMHASNNGDVGRDEMTFTPDGAMLMLATRTMGGMTFCERATTKVDGDTMSMKIDFLMAAGPSMRVVEGEFKRTDAAVADVLATGAYQTQPTEQMKQLGRSAGVYGVEGAMIWQPGMPEMKIHGTDTFQAVFGNTVLHGHTSGGSDMSDDEYVSDVFWGWNATDNCYRGVYVSNAGESGEMEARWSADGKVLVQTASGTNQGQPIVQRFLLHVAADGSFQKAVGHSIIGTGEPLQTFEATYSKKDKKSD